MKQLKLIGIGVLAALAAIIIYQNRHDTRADFLFATVTMPKAMLLLVTLALGFGLGLLVAGPRKRGR